ncbi:MAG: amidohydrolase family protein [Deltaproteobacteria bacterium]|nr:amidohydrolase family protein [Deltaproteobacteria bacterium]
MLNGIFVYDADAHVMVSQRMWEDMPEPIRQRRPRPVRIDDHEDFGGLESSWFVEGRLTPRHWGPGSQPANNPATTNPNFSGTNLSLPVEIGSRDLSQPELRIKDLDRMGIDCSVMYPSTLYATMAMDAELEAALYRSFNRYMAKACQWNPKRLKWAGLIPLRNPVEACRAIAEMKESGATAAVVFGTAGERSLSDPSFYPAYDELVRAGLPLSIHFGMSFPPLWDISRTMFSGQFLGMTLPVFLGFYAVTAGGLMDRYPSLKVGFLEFGSEWLLYVVPRMERFRRMALRRGTPMPTDMPQREILQYLRSGNFFVTCEGDDELLPEEIELMGDNNIMFASDMPHPEMRDNAAAEIFENNKISDLQKRKILSDNVIRYYGEA